MADYSSNSHASKASAEKEAPQKNEAVAHASLHKKKGLEKLAETFLTEDVDSAKTYVVRNMIIPGIKRLIMGTIGAFLGVESGANSWYYGKSTTAGNVAFRKYNEAYDNGQSKKTYRRVWYEDVIVASMGEAQMIMDRMNQILETYYRVRVLDLYEVAGVETNFTDSNYGWTNISQAKILETRAGYLIKMPAPYPLR